MPEWVMGLCSFDGRITRCEWWIRLVVLWAVQFLAFVLSGLGEGWFIVLGVVYVVTFWMILAADAKRWHDLGKSGWWTLVGLIPIVGPIYLLCSLGFQKGEEGSNEYGPSPYPEPCTT